MPDHGRAIWRLPEEGADSSMRWTLITESFSRPMPNTERVWENRERKAELRIWQRRFWGHQLRDARVWIEVWIYPQRVQETDRGVERVLSSFLNGDGSKSQQPPPISTGIANLLNELGLHGRIPRLFCALTFENISLLRSRLACFLPEYEMAPDAAVALPQVSSSPHRFRTKIP